MKLTIPVKALMRALAAVKSVTSSRTTLPILHNVLLEASGDDLRVTACDLDRQISITVRAEIDRPGSVTLPAAALHATLARLSAESVSLDADAKSHVSLKCGKVSAKLLGLPVEEFPNNMKVTETAALLVTGELLGEWLRKALPFVSVDASRYVLNGVNIATQDGKLRITSTDGHRMLIMTSDLPCEPIDIIVPTEAVRALKDLLSDGEIALSFGETALEARGANWRFVTKLIEGNYPNIWNAIPQESSRTKRLTVPREQLISALDMATVFAMKESESAALRADGTRLMVQANRPDFGEAVSEIECPPGNCTIGVAFKAHYLIEVMTTLAGDTATFELVDEKHPACFTEPGMIIALCPMRLV